MKTCIRTLLALALGFFARTASAVTYELSGDENWCTRTDPFPDKVNLKGHNLTVAQFTGTCEITDSTANGGELRVNCTSDSVKPATVTLSGSLKLVKTGPGKLTWGGGTFATTNPILVTNGVLKLGVTTANVFGSSGRIVVKGKGQFDLNFISGNGSTLVDSPVLGKTFELEGDGPDGTGAFVNTSVNKTWSGRHLSSVILTGDATIGGSARIDLRSGSLDGHEHTLTVKNTQMLCFSGGILQNCRAVVLTGKGILQPCANNSIATTVGEIVLLDGIFANWASGANTWQVQVPVRVGTGGGTARSDAAYFALCKPLTVGDNGTLTWQSGPWCCGGVTNKSGSTIRVTGNMFVASCTFVNDGLVEFAANNNSFSLGSPYNLQDPYNNTIPCRVVNNGTIRSTAGTFTLVTPSIAEGAGTFEVTGGTAALDGNLTDFTGTIRLGGGTTSIARASDFAGSLVLKDGVLAAGTSLAGFTGTATIDVSDRSAPLSVDGKNWFTFSSGRTVYVDVGARKLADGEKILDWSVMPANADKIDFRVIANGFVLQVPPLVNAVGLYYPDASAITVAHWTGKAGDGDVGTAGNWACTNVAGQGVSDVLPTEATSVYFPGANLPAITNGASFVAAVVNVNAALSSDCDWSGMSVPMSGVIDLKGRNLTVGQLTGTCEITDSTANGGELRVDCASDSVKPETVVLSGSLKLVKTGPGKFTWGGGTFATTNSILITNGVLKLDVKTLNVFGSSGKIIVKEKGQFDLNYYSGNGSTGDSPVFGKTFEIEGDGPDGTGVLVNTYEKDWSGRHFNSVVLTGDATIGGTAHIDFRSGSLDGCGHTLTVKNSKKLCFSGGILQNCRAVVLTEKGVLQPCANDSIATTVGEIILQDGIFANWAPGNTTTWAIQSPVRVGAGGGTTRNDGSGSFALLKPLTVADNGTLEWLSGTWCCGGVTNKSGSTIHATGYMWVATGAFVNDGLVEFAAKTGSETFSFGSPINNPDPYNNKIPCRVVNNGTIRSTAGTFTFRTESIAEGAGTFEVTGGTAALDGNLTDFTGTIRLGGGTTSIAKVSDFTGTLVLKDGVLAAGTSLAGFTGTATIDVSDRSAPLSVDGKNWFTFAEGKTVYVDVGARKLADGEKILDWSAMPANADKIDFRVIAGGFVLQVPPQINTTGLYYPDASAITVAHWTGKAGNGDINTALNWACTNVAGQGVAGALPTEMTTVYFAGANLPAITNGATFAAAVVNVSAALSSDCDWGGMSVPMSGVIDLKGHNLTVGQLTGTYEITDSTANGGELRVNCTSDSVKPETVVLSGSLKLVKTGPGKLTWGGGTFATTNPILVTNGVLKLGVTTANVFGSSGRIVVKGKGQFDLNYTTSNAAATESPVFGKTFELEGDGPDGTGAFVNTSAKQWGGKHLNTVLLTGDATIGGTARIDLRSGSLDGNGHTLTVKNTQMLCFSGGILQNCRAVVMTGKGVLQPCANNSIATTVGEIVLLDGIFANWASGGANTWQVQVPVRVGTGGGTARSDAAYFALCKPLTVGDNGTLTWQAGPWCCGGVTNKSGSTIRVTGDMFVANGAFVNDGLVEFAANKTFALGSHRDDLQYPYNNTIPCRVVNNGTIRVSNGTLKFVAKSLAEGAGTFEVTGGTADFAGSLKDFTGTIRLGGGTTSIAKASDFTGSLVLKDGVLAAGTSLAGFTGTATIDVSDRSEPLAVDGRNWFTFASGKTVYVDVGEREIAEGTRLLSWTTRPTGVRFAFADGRKGSLVKDDEGVVYLNLPMRIIIR